VSYNLYICVLLELSQSTVSAVNVKRERLGATTAQATQAHRMETQSAEVLQLGRSLGYELTADKNRLSSVATLTTEFHTDSGCNVSKITVRREQHEMEFPWPSSRTQV
jgi:hypothetical protein